MRWNLFFCWEVVFLGKRSVFRLGIILSKMKTFYSSVHNHFPVCLSSRETSMTKPYIGAVRNHPPSPKNTDWWRFTIFPRFDSQRDQPQAVLLGAKGRHKTDSICPEPPRTKELMLFNFRLKKGHHDWNSHRENTSFLLMSLLPTLCWASINYTGLLAYLRMAQCVPSPHQAPPNINSTITEHIN